MSTFFLDFEAFQHGKEDFRVKELCILDVTKPLKPLNLVFKPEIRWDELSKPHQRTFSYQENNIHHLSWDEGTTRYCAKCVMHMIKQQFPVVTSYNTICFVAGREKTKFIQREFPMLNIFAYDRSASFKDLPAAPSHLSCNYRDHSREHCAMLKCYQLYTDFESI